MTRSDVSHVASHAAASVATVALMDLVGAIDLAPGTSVMLMAVNLLLLTFCWHSREN